MISRSELTSGCRRLLCNVNVAKFEVLKAEEFCIKPSAIEVRQCSSSASEEVPEMFLWVNVSIRG